MENKHIVFVVAGLSSGGTERFLSILANYLADKKCIVSIISLTKTDVFYSSLEERFPISCLNISKKTISSILFASKKLKKNILLAKPNVVISLGFKVSLLTLFSLIKTSIPVITREGNDPRNDGRSFVDWFFAFFLFGKAKYCVFQSSYQMKCYPKKFWLKSRVIHNPVSFGLNCRPFFNEQRQSFISFGRLVPSKRLDVLILAFCEYQKRHSDAQLYIYGDGPLKNSLERLISSKGLSQFVFLSHPTENVISLFSGKKAFIFSSEREGTPNSVLEAMSFGLPVISSKWPGFDEFLVDGVNSLLFNIDDISGLFYQMEKINDPNVSYSLSEAGKKTIKTFFNNRTIFKKWCELIS